MSTVLGTQTAHQGARINPWTFHTEIFRLRSTPLELLRPWVLGFRASGFGFWVLGFGLHVAGFGFRVWDLGFRVSGFEFRVSGFGFRVSGFGFCFFG